MTPRERVLAALRGEPTDRLPFAIYDILSPRRAAQRRLLSQVTEALRGSGMVGNPARRLRDRHGQ